MQLSLAAARELIAAALAGSPARIERVGLDEAAGRHLAADLQASFGMPPVAVSAMDGYALRSSDAAASGPLQLPLAAARSLAGTGAVAPLPPGMAMRITTGAALPAGADAVVIQENCRINAGQLGLEGPIAPGSHVRQAGEDYAAGARLLPAGTRLGPIQLALLASQGLAEARVLVPPRVAILVTGDELLAPGQVRQGAAIYDSNGPLLAALVRACGGHPLPVVRVGDDADATAAALQRCAAGADLVLTCGGASVGEADHLPEVLRRHGHLHFWKLRLKPGMPALFGEYAGTPVLSLPGNPVSACITFLLLGRFALRLRLGVDPADPPPLPVRLAVPLAKRHARLEYQRCRLELGLDGNLARPLAAQGSHQLSGLRDADALLELPEGPLDWPAGQPARAWRIADWIGS